LTSTAHTDAGLLGTGREENINFLSDLSDDDDEDGDGASPQVTYFLPTLYHFSVLICVFGILFVANTS